MYSLAPENYIEPKSGFKSDLKQMLLNIIQQQEEHVSRLCNLVNKGAEFEVFFCHKKVLSAVEHVIGKEYKLSSLNLRSPKKECWVQPLHVDWPWTVQPGSHYSSNTLWILDDTTSDNGPTRVIPGTHNKGKSPGEEMPDLQASHPDEITITAKAGSVLILNGHVWHGGTSNVSGKPRDLIQSYFVHRAHHPQQFQSYLLTSETKQRLKSETLKILDYPYNHI